MVNLEDLDIIALDENGELGSAALTALSSAGLARVGHSHSIDQVGGLDDALSARALLEAGLPAGGAPGQVLSKAASADFAVRWSDLPPAGAPGAEPVGGTVVGSPVTLDASWMVPADAPDSRAAIQAALDAAVNGGERSYWAFLEMAGGYVKVAPGTYRISAPSNGMPSLVIPRGVTFDFSQANLVFDYPSAPTTSWAAVLFKSQSGLVLGRMKTRGQAPDSAHVYDAVRLWHTDNYNRLTGGPHAKIQSFQGAAFRGLGSYVSWIENVRVSFTSHGVVHGESNGLVPDGSAPYDWPTAGVGGEAVGAARRPTDLWVKDVQFDNTRGDVFVVGAVGSRENPNGLKGSVASDPTTQVTGGNLHLDTVLVEGTPARVIRAKDLSQVIVNDLHIEEAGATGGPILDIDVVYGQVVFTNTRINTSMSRPVTNLAGAQTTAKPSRLFSLGVCRQFRFDGLYLQNSGSDMVFAVESWGGAWSAMKYRVAGLALDPANTGHLDPGNMLTSWDEQNTVTNAAPAVTFVEDPAGSGVYRMV